MTKRAIFAPVLAPVPRYLMRLDCIARLLDACPADVQHFLEIGPGLGDIAAYLLERHPDADGQLVEFSEMAARQLAQRFAHTKRINISVEDLLAGHLAPRFDLILAFEVLEHIEDDRAALELIHAALEPGGHFLMSVPAFMKKWEKGDNWAGHYRRYEKQELQDKLTATGLQIQTLWGYGFPVATLFYPLRQLYYHSSSDTSNPDSKQAASQQSGVNRPWQAPGWSPWFARLMWPLFFMQHAARNTKLGDGWIVLAQKPA